MKIVNVVCVELKNFFVKNKGISFRFISGIVLLMTAIMSAIGILGFINSNTSSDINYNIYYNAKTVFEDDELVKKIVIGLSIENIDNLFGTPVITTECSASKVKKLADNVSDKTNEAITNPLNNRYYVLDKYIIRCVFDNDKLIAYFITIRNRGDVLPQDMPEIILSGLGEKTYAEILNTFNMVLCNIPASNNQFMFYGEMIQQRPIEFHNLIYCSLDYGFNNCNKYDKSSQYDYHNLAIVAEKNHFIEKWVTTDIFGIESCILKIYSYIDQEELLKYEEDRSQILPNTVGIIANGYECVIELMDGGLSRTTILMIKEY